MRVFSPPWHLLSPPPLLKIWLDINACFSPTPRDVHAELRLDIYSDTCQHASKAMRTSSAYIHRSTNAEAQFKVCLPAPESSDVWVWGFFILEENVQFLLPKHVTKSSWKCKITPFSSNTTLIPREGICYWKSLSKQLPRLKKGGALTPSPASHHASSTLRCYELQFSVSLWQKIINLILGSPSFF